MLNFEVVRDAGYGVGSSCQVSGISPMKLKINNSRLIPCLRRNGYVQAGEELTGWFVRKRDAGIPDL